MPSASSTLTPTTSLSSRVWTAYLSLRLPWRRRWLAGTDLSRNRYFYFRPTLSSTAPPRRIMQPFAGSGRRTGSLGGYADVRVPVQWHQWLRYTREEPPSLGELREDVVRQERMRILAREADRRWEMEKRRLEGGKRTDVEGEGKERKILVSAGGEIVENDGGERMVDDESKKGEPGLKRKQETSPWKRRDRGTPGDEFQPEAWMPSSLKNRVEG